jgi:hypothetical protein
MRVDIVHRYTLAVCVHRPAIEVCLDVSLVCSLLKPHRSIIIVFHGTLALVAHESELKLGLGMSLPGSMLEPSNRSRVALRYAHALVVHETEIVLGDCIALFGKWQKQPPQARSRGARMLCDCPQERLRSRAQQSSTIESLWRVVA